MIDYNTKVYHLLWVLTIEFSENTVLISPGFNKVGAATTMGDAWGENVAVGATDANGVIGAIAAIGADEAPELDGARGAGAAIGAGVGATGWTEVDWGAKTSELAAVDEQSTRAG